MDLSLFKEFKVEKKLAPTPQKNNEKIIEKKSPKKEEKIIEKKPIKKNYEKIVLDKPKTQEKSKTVEKLNVEKIKAKKAIRGI